MTPGRAGILLIATAFFIGSCKKEVVGPKGEKGDTGAGNTVVYTSEPFAVASSSWQHPPGDSTYWRTVIYSDKITADVVNRGTVSLMIKENESWWELPYVIDRENLTTFGYEQGIIRLANYDLHGMPPRPGTHTFRFTTMVPN